jgi:hypothetical protein
MVEVRVTIARGNAMANGTQTQVGRDVLVGFVAGALAVLIFHQIVVLLLGFVGMARGAPWSFAAMPPFGVPRLINSMFWGGLWGIVYALIADRLPRQWPLWLAGFVFGLVGPVLVGWTIVAAIKGNALFAGFVPMRMLTSILINGAFGIGVALIFAWLRGMFGSRRAAVG